MRGTAAAAADFPEVADLGVIDGVLHSVNHRDRPKKLADICFKLNIEIVAYCQLRAEEAGQGRTCQWRETGQGSVLFHNRDRPGADCRYREIREACLRDAFSALGAVDRDSLGELARRLGVLSGLYGQAAQRHQHVERGSVAMPRMMKVWYEENGPADKVLIYGEMPVPVPAAGEVLVASRLREPVRREGACRIAPDGL